MIFVKRDIQFHNLLDNYPLYWNITNYIGIIK